VRGSNAGTDALMTGAIWNAVNRSLMAPAPLLIADETILARNVRSRDGFQMAAGWMRAGYLRPGRRLKAPEEGNRGQRRSAMEI